MKQHITETFDQNGYEFVPVGEERYGLRGDKLSRSNISNWYIRPDRQIRLNHSNGEMYISNYNPTLEGISECKKVQCPTYNCGYDNMDECYKCGHNYPMRIKIPDIHPHVPN